MKCPLMTDKDYSIQLERNLNLGDCIKEECAWWIAGDERCAVLVAAAYLAGLVAIGDRLLEKKL